MGLEFTSDNNFNFLLNLVGFIQALTLGILFLVLHFQRKKNTLFLALFLVLFSLQSIWPSISNAAFGAANPELFLLPINFSWLLFPLFFTYSHSICIYSSKKAPYWILYPGLVSVVAQSIIYFQPYLTKLTISQSVWHNIFFTYMGLFFSLCIVIWNLIICKNHKTEVGNVFSKVEAKELKWIVYFLVYGILHSIFISVLPYFNTSGGALMIIFSILDIVAIFWVAFYGLTQERIQPFPLDTGTPNKHNEYPKPDNPRPQQLPRAELENIMSRIENHMFVSEQFTHPDLTVMDLANELNLQPKQISTVVNKVCNRNFNTYINDQRINKAKLLLHSDTHRHLSIEGIGIEAGFHSRSAFYAAFKKRTGTTPIRFREEVMI